MTNTSIPTKPASPKLSKGTRCLLIEDGKKGQVTKAGPYIVKGVFDDGTPFRWSREGFFKDFKI